MWETLLKTSGNKEIIVLINTSLNMENVLVYEVIKR